MDESAKWQRKYDRAATAVADLYAGMLIARRRSDLAINRANLSAEIAKEKYETALARLEALSNEMRHNPKIKWDDVAASRAAELH